MREILKGHTSPETAYVVDDYPYGFRLRCKIRYWLEFDPKKGYRFCSQTTNPKVTGEVWNKPKKSTYCRFGGVMLLVDAPEGSSHEHEVTWTGLGIYGDVAEIKAWADKYGDALPEEGKEILNVWLRMKARYEAHVNAGG